MGAIPSPPSPILVKLRACFLLLSLLATAAFAQAPERPQGVALVLSGGGARGVAHVGVLKVLEDMRIPVDCIVGTSMGAIVGGAYASGMSLPDMVREINAVDWGSMFSNNVPREDQPFRDKQDAARNRSAIVMGYGDGRLLLPQSAISGQAMDRFLTRLAGGADVLPSFDTLSLPFRAVATDLESGAEVLLDKGPLWRAMRASMAVPGVFLPIENNDRLLVDGGLVMNLPVDEGRRLCGGRVIAVNLGTPPQLRDRLLTATDIVLQAINLALEQNVRQQIEHLGPDDALVQVELGDITSRDFDRALETVPYGTIAALKQSASLARFSVDAETYAKWQAQRQQRRNQPAPVVDSIAIQGLKVVPERLFGATLSQKTGEPLDTAKLETDIGQIYSRGDFDRLRYSVLRDGPRATVQLEADEKASGPNLLRFGGGVTADFEGDSTLGVYAGFSRRWLNTRGARWDVDMQLGTTNRIRSELYQPLDLDSGWFVAPSVELFNRVLPIFVDGRKLSENKERGGVLGLDLGYEMGMWGELRAGLRRGERKSEVVSGPVLYPERTVADGSMQLGAVIDRLDSPFFPRHGYAARLRGEVHDPSLGDDHHYLFTELDGDAAMSLGANVLRLRGLFTGSPDRDLPEVGRTQLGGPFRLSGYRYGEVAGDQVALATASYYRLITRLPDSVGRGVYAGATAEWADVRNYGAALTPDPGRRRAMSLFLGADTVLGPLYLGASYLPELGEMRYYLQIGQPQ
ncbi:MAG TPA: patatin-like phospholipase family protein [Aromatoleum sp.]|uniref:patatin-like phospholipase family protein n=1 Tax=Aromatoleum sp. TaxID=2307007 RepID=UPI002B486028|nr:patatin-like phospholipase family protein [Aromatoleum sp.]HJV27053.1 patatin-like phospholipase family protein [Aromatoleum sp.]